MYKLINKIQNYPWGSYTAIPEILGIDNVEQKPFAELWMGDHSRAVSKVLINSDKIPLNDFIKTNPDLILGDGNKRLPFLLKILSSAKPLSIQLHPNKLEAKTGFFRENKENIPIEAPYRNYKDDNHKPEIIYAISPFIALKGFRRFIDIYNDFAEINSEIIKDKLEDFKNDLTIKGLKSFFSFILNLSNESKNYLIEETKNKQTNSNDAFQWLSRLYDEYGTDIGIFAPLFLNIIELRPGEALFIKAGELHAYLLGTGIELMASSDNVLRGGLTNKHIDKKELLSLTNFSESETTRVETIKKENGEEIFITEPDDFQLSKIELKEKSIFTSEFENKARIILCLEGKFILTNKMKTKTINISKGESVFIPANTEQFTLKGQGLIFKAI